MRAAVPALGRPADCRPREVLDRVGDKWSLLVIGLLGRRHQTVQRAAPQHRWHQPAHAHRHPSGLERDGLVTRTVHPTVPPRVNYTLTPMGRTLLDTARALVDWAERHLHEIDAARTVYDRRAAVLSRSLDSQPGDPPRPHE
jgi:DNA-binding HxlR family transcriptional regulator